MKTKTKLLASILFSLSTVLVVVTCIRHNQAHSTHARNLLTDKEYAQSQSSMGIMSQSESLRWIQITDSIRLRGSITDPELDWLIQELPQPAPTPTPMIAATRRLELMLSIKQSKVFTPTQKERIYQATIGYLPGPERNDKMAALAVMRHLREKRAIPGITLLTDDPDATVRASARKTLKVINTPAKA